MKKTLLIPIFLLLLSSCQSQIKFEENFWGQPQPEQQVITPVPIVPEVYPESPGRFPTYGPAPLLNGCEELRARGGDC